MPVSRLCRFLSLLPWIALVGGSLSANAQQAPATPGPLMAPALAPKSGLATDVNTTLDIATPTPSGSSTTGAFTPPKVLQHPNPSYPELALLNRVEGVVHIHFAVDEEGHVTGVSVPRSSGNTLLDLLAKDAALHEWTFQPATFNGQPVPGGADKEFEFKLDPNEQRVLAEKRLALALGTPDPPYPPEALAFRPPPKGACTVAVRWTKAGLVDHIYMPQSTGSGTLDRTALRFAYSNWRTDPATAAKDEPFSKVIKFTPP